MTKYTRRDKQRLAPEIIAKFHDAGQRCDLEAFKRLSAEYGAHLPREVKDELIAEFKRNADALRRALREKQ
jgi:hypothetical protein